MFQKDRGKNSQTKNFETTTKTPASYKWSYTPGQKTWFYRWVSPVFLNNTYINLELFFTLQHQLFCFLGPPGGPKTSGDPRFTSMNLVIHIGLQSQHLPHNLKVWRFFFFGSGSGCFFRKNWGLERGSPLRWRPHSCLTPSKEPYETGYTQWIPTVRCI